MNFGCRATGEVLLCGRRVLSGREEVHRLGDPVRVETTGLELVGFYRNFISVQVASN